MLNYRTQLVFLGVVCSVGWRDAKGATLWEAKVVGVADGDTITVLRNKKAVRVRLFGVDTPEKNQPFGQKAKAFTSRLVFGKTVMVNVVNQDRYGRTVAHVIVEGKELNEELLKAGLAWHYTRYDHSERYARHERQARDAKRGLWREVHPVAPWDWRHHPKERHTPAATSFTPGLSTAVFVGNTKSMVFHKKGCRAFTCKHCTQRFLTRELALGQGFHPCGMCKP